MSRADSVVREDNVPGLVAALVAGPAEPIVVVLDQTGGTGELAGPAHTILTEHHGRGMPGTPTSMATSEAGANGGAGAKAKLTVYTVCRGFGCVVAAA